MYLHDADAPNPMEPQRLTADQALLLMDLMDLDGTDTTVVELCLVGNDVVVARRLESYAQREN